MSLDGDYDDRNPFRLILDGALPAARLYEDDATLAFLDIMPQAEGHSLVISKTSRARTILDIEPEALAQVMATVQRVARGLRETLAPDGLQIIQLSGADAGQTVFHLHVHVIPRRKGGVVGLAVPESGGRMADPQALAALAERIRANIG